MQSVFSYTDYRKFLGDWYAEKKAVNTGFSHRLIAQKLGFRSAGHFALIIQGKTNISVQIAMKFAAFIKLKTREAEFFQYMVLFNQAKTHADKQLYFEKMRGFKESSVRLVDEACYEYYGRWYHAAIRALIGIMRIRDEYEALAALLVPSVPVADVRKSIDLLLALKLIERDPDGYLRMTESLVSTGYGIQAFALTNYLLDSHKLASAAFDRFPRDQRNMSCLALGISARGFVEIQNELREFRRRIMEIAERDSADRVYQLSFQFFPLSKQSTQPKDAA